MEKLARDRAEALNSFEAYMSVLVIVVVMVVLLLLFVAVALLLLLFVVVALLLLLWLSRHVQVHDARKD